MNRRRSSPADCDPLKSKAANSLDVVSQRGDLLLDAADHFQKACVSPAGGILQPPVLPVSAGQRRAGYVAPHGNHDVNGGKRRQELAVLGFLHIDPIELLHYPHFRRNG